MALITLKIISGINLYTSRSDITVFYREMNTLFESAWKMSLRGIINISIEEKRQYLKKKFFLACSLWIIQAVK